MQAVTCPSVQCGSPICENVWETMLASSDKRAGHCRAGPDGEPRSKAWHDAGGQWASSVLSVKCALTMSSRSSEAPPEGNGGKYAGGLALNPLCKGNGGARLLWAVRQAEVPVLEPCGPQPVLEGSGGTVHSLTS